MKIDLHVHSKFSTRPSQWILQKLGCPESFTEPQAIYRACRERGMDMVTVTDHNGIEGSLAIAHLPGTFVSEEITAYFPEDRCKLHVLAWDIDEAVHREVQRLRENVYDLVAYLRAEKIAHACAHPLYGVNDRLSVEHFERLLLLFRAFEINGTRDEQQNSTVRMILSLLNREDIERLADKHNLIPGVTGMDEPWRKSLTGGSDDHGGIDIARIHTEVAHAADLRDFLRGIEVGDSRPLGPAAGPKNLARNLYSIAYQFYKSRFDVQRYVSQDLFLRFVDRSLDPFPQEEAGALVRLRNKIYERIGRHQQRTVEPTNVQGLMRREAGRIISENPLFADIARKGRRDLTSSEQDWHDFVTRASHTVSRQFADRLLDSLSGANLFDVFGSVGSAGTLYAMLAPYFVAYGVFTKDRAFCKQVARRFLHRESGRGDDSQSCPTPASIKVAHFTDTFYEINGVARTLQRMTELADASGKRLCVLTCKPEALAATGPGSSFPGVRNFEPAGEYALPEYPEQRVFYPPILEMLDYVFEQDATHIHTATPGPLGLTALLIARILKLPIHGTYHTQIPQYVQRLTGDEEMEALAWKFTIWFYNQMDLVFAPSRSTANELIEKGLPAEKVVVFPRGVDVDRYHPAKRNGFFKRYEPLAASEETGDAPLRMLYVGRLSKEKNLDLLVNAFRTLSAEFPETRLVLVGDGPHAEELRAETRDLNALFTGVLEGDELAQAYASSDVFVFPSTTDTFGNVVLEAQASGLPVIVSDKGGPMENVAQGETGFIVPADDEAALLAAMRKLAADHGLRTRMAAAAREAMSGRGFEQAFEETWRLYAEAGTQSGDQSAETYGPTNKLNPFAIFGAMQRQ